MQRLHYKHVDALVDKETGLFRRFLSEDMIQPEQWKDVPRYEGYYQVSDKGRVRSLDRWVDNNGGKFFRKGKLMQVKSDHKGRFVIGLQKNGTRTCFGVDYLLGMSFFGVGENSYGIYSWVDGVKENIALSNLAINKTTDERLREEAALVGLKFLGKGTKTGNRLYQFIGCGHKRILPTGDVREGSFSCTECYTDKLHSSATACNCEIVSDPLKTNKVIVKFKTCGHEKQVFKTKLQEGYNLFCQVCKDIRWRENLEKQGLELLEAFPKQLFRLRFKKCNHEVMARSSNAFSGRISCDICRIENWKQEANNSGLTWLSRAEVGDGKKHKGHYLLPCGCTANIRYSAVRAGHWKCPSCDKNYLNFPNALYLYQMKNGDKEWLKLGYAREPKSRKSDYKLSEGTTADLLLVVKTPTGQFALDNENSLHKKYKKFNLCKKTMRDFLTESGFTECYDIQIKECLLNDLKEIQIELAKRE